MTILDEVVASVEYRCHALTVEPWVAGRILNDEMMSEQELVIVFVDEDADDPRLPARPYVWRAPCPKAAQESEAACLRWVFEMIVQNEAHELSEFFKFKTGGRPFDPHKFGTPKIEVHWQ
jgi:hypothetical protein